MRKPTHMVYLFMKVYPAFGGWQKNDIKRYDLNLTITWHHTDPRPYYNLPDDHADRINWDKGVDIITKASFSSMWACD